MIYFIIFIALNLISFLLYGIDKWKAKRNMYRIPENVLIGSALFFSSYGAFLGMYTFHHKTRKFKFMFLIPLFVIFHTYIIYEFFLA